MFKVEKSCSGSEEVSTLRFPSYREMVLSLKVRQKDPMPRNPLSLLREPGAVCTGQFLFYTGTGSESGEPEPAAGIEGPCFQLVPSGRYGGSLEAAQFIGLAGIEVQPLLLEGRLVGVTYEDFHARYCRMAGVLPDDAGASRRHQVQSVFGRMAAVLRECRMSFGDTVRTWLYLDRLLEWYDEFNFERTEFFSRNGIFQGVVPASTGVGAANPFGAAISAGLLAVQPKSGETAVSPVPSPLQCPATAYRSSFSRAVEIGFPTHRSLLISGTASIDAGGESIHRDDPRGQIGHTMQVVKALLESRRMSWADAVRGIAYYTDLRHHRLFQSYCLREGIPSFPLTPVEAEICRRDLQFEIEVDAVRAGD